ncbi:MAG: DMT family transporter, partial [Clostridiales bacterium]|nr:DMT family transporter [Clostridiales bacterium]
MVIFNRKAASIAGLENAMWQLLAAFVTVAAFVGLRQGLALRIPPASWPPILVLGAINTGLGCYFYFSSIGRLPVRAVAILGYLEPLSAVLFSMLFLQARLTGAQSAGAALILGGAAFGQLFRPARKSGRNADECI